MQKNTKNKRVLLFLASGFEAYEASVFTDIIGWSHEAGSEPVDVITTGLHSRIKCSWNLIVEPEVPFVDINPEDFDALAIPGGMEWAGFYDDAFDERVLALIREFDKKKQLIASVCVAALALGKAGVLNGRKATTWDLNHGKRQKELAGFGAVIQNKPVVTDEYIITSIGPSTGPDVAFTLLEMLTDKTNTGHIKKDMRFL